MSDTTYNGWRNKETWLVNLWIGDVITGIVEDSGESVDAEWIESFVDEIVESYGIDLESGFMWYMLQCALGEIDYGELAEHFKSEADS